MVPLPETYVYGALGGGEGTGDGISGPRYCIGTGRGQNDEKGEGFGVHGGAGAGNGLRSSGSVATAARRIQQVSVGGLKAIAPSVTASSSV